MYQEHFGLKQEPFSIAPDPAFLFLSDAHNEALAHLMYGFTHGGFVLITGEVGTGKTTLLRNLLNRTPPDLDVAFILNPRLTVRELLETICDELGVPYAKDELQSVKQYIDVLNKHLLKTHQSGRSTVVIIDEAQNLSPAVLEQIRLLTNLETNEKKLLRIILLGQPELAELLDRTELRQLAQRITARYHLTPLSKVDVVSYVSHRLARAGGNPNIFNAAALRALYRLSKGTPRLINVIADRAMLGAYVEGTFQVTRKLVTNGAKEVLGNQASVSSRYFIGATAVVAVIAAVMIWAYISNTTEPVQPLEPNQTAQPSARSSTPQGNQAQSSLQASPQSSPQITPQLNRQASAKQSSSPIAGADRGDEPAESNKAQDSINTTQQDEITIADGSIEVIASFPQGELQQGELQQGDSPVDLRRPAGGTYNIRRRAYRAVFDQWGADYPLDSDKIPCDFAPGVGLQCLSKNGSWSEIATLDSPVVLELWDTQNAPYYAALLKSDGERYQISVGGQTMNASPRDLRDNWFGAYVVLWQTPPGYNGSLREGDNHPTVQWLHERLLELRPQAQLDAPQRYFSAELRKAVIEFQRNEGLLADGIVGPLTWIRLSDRLNLPAPKLRS
jgi:general secretion pathway protein A